MVKLKQTMLLTRFVLRNDKQRGLPCHKKAGSKPPSPHGSPGEESTQRRRQPITGEQRNAALTSFRPASLPIICLPSPALFWICQTGLEHSHELSRKVGYAGCAVPRAEASMKACRWLGSVVVECMLCYTAPLTCRWSTDLRVTMCINEEKSILHFFRPVCPWKARNSGGYVQVMFSRALLRGQTPGALLNHSFFQSNQPTSSIAMVITLPSPTQKSSFVLAVAQRQPWR